MNKTKFENFYQLDLGQNLAFTSEIGPDLGYTPSSQILKKGFMR